MAKLQAIVEPRILLHADRHRLLPHPVTFNPLSSEVMVRIVRKLIRDLEALLGAKNASLRITDTATCRSGLFSFLHSKQYVICLSMKASSIKTVLLALVIVIVMITWQLARPHRQQKGLSGNSDTITIDYPVEGSVFPPEMSSPTWLWRDPVDRAVLWTIEMSFPDNTPSISVQSRGEPMRLGESDPRCVSPHNKPPALTPEQAAAHTWTPDAATWSVIKKHSVEGPATMVITGHSQDNTVVSRGRASFRTSKDPVGAPVFYRDVPLMPLETERGVIKPLDASAYPLISWKLRNIEERESRTLMEGLYTCANCHSFSADGKTLGMDMDGPQNDKGLYAIAEVEPEMSIRNEDLVEWSTFRGKLGSKLRVGFMSQLSPDARFVVTTVNDPGVDQTSYQRRRKPVDLEQNLYVANFKDHRFLQVFYPTRGVLAWYDRKAGHLRYLPGADDTGYVHTNAVWSPDGKYLVFARAKARDAYPDGMKKAQYAGDPNELQMRYDLYRIPFNEGKGGKPEPIAGASNNGMSNSFPKVSPDGRWMVYVQSKNGLLMRPDSRLYIVPAAGGTARRMKCNTSLMNSWHSFSPSGRWMVFSSKSRSPYTQMFLTHIDETGEDSPPILIENTTAANRAVNLPEFVNVPPGGLEKIDAPAARYARHMDKAVELLRNRQLEAALEEWSSALELAPEESLVHNGLGFTLSKMGRYDQAIVHFEKALILDPQFAEACNNLGDALARKKNFEEAIVQFERAARMDPAYTPAHENLRIFLTHTGQTDKAIDHLKKVVEAMPDSADARRSLGHALLDNGDLGDAGNRLEEASRLAGGTDPLTLHLLGRVYAGLGRIQDDIRIQKEALSTAEQQNNYRVIQLINKHMATLDLAQ